MDAKDILGLPKTPFSSSQEKKSRTPKEPQRKPDGVSREVYALTGGVGMAPLMPTIEASHLKRRPAAEKEKIRIPSVEALSKCGVRFTAAPPGSGIEGIAFDRATATLRLPIITLDANTEVVLRNLVAYEAVAVRGPLVLARYTELMNGIIDTSIDVKILRRSGVVVNHMKSNRDAAGMWNGMARATRLTRVPRLDAVIAAVNAHRSRSAAARLRKMLRKYVFRSWKVLTLVASVGLLLMTALQTFCSAYPCENHWFSGTVMPGTTDDPPQ